MTLPTLTLTEDRLDGIVAEHIARTLPPERIESLANKAIEARIGRLTLPEAARYLKCTNVRQLKEFCRGHEIPIRSYSRQNQFILLKDIESADQRAAVKVPAADGATTIIAPVT